MWLRLIITFSGFFKWLDVKRNRNSQFERANNSLHIQSQTKNWSDSIAARFLFISVKLCAGFNTPTKMLRKTIHEARNTFEKFVFSKTKIQHARHIYVWLPPTISLNVVVLAEWKQKYSTVTELSECMVYLMERQKDTNTHGLVWQ